MEITSPRNNRCAHVDLACDDLVVTRGLLAERPKDTAEKTAEYRSLAAAVIIRCQGDGCPLLKRDDFLSTGNA